jgi:hypothetical protein
MIAERVKPLPPPTRKTGHHTSDLGIPSATVLGPQRGETTKPRPTAWVSGTQTDARALKGRNNAFQSQTYRSS